jgi:pimeloyl-ACP methyl ester carboxylesterase
MANWGFDPAEITMRLQFWHGDLDSVVPIEFARTQIARIPHASVKYLPDSGHMSLVLWGKGAILDYLKATME